MSVNLSVTLSGLAPSEGKRGRKRKRHDYSNEGCLPVTRRKVASSITM